MRYTRREQGQGVQPFALDCLLHAPPALGDVAQDNRMTHLYSRYVDLILGRPPFDHERNDVKINEAVGWIKNLDIAADRPATLRERPPIQSADALIEPFSDGIAAIQTKHLAGGFVQISDASV